MRYDIWLNGVIFTSSSSIIFYLILFLYVVRILNYLIALYNNDCIMPSCMQLPNIGAQIFLTVMMMFKV